jgi:ribosome biogenesis GTPase
MARRHLTDRQKARIAKIQEQRRRRVAARTEAQAGEHEPSALLQEGTVVAQYGRNLVVADARGIGHHCRSRANLSEMVCGDRVIWQPTGADEGVVTALLPRRTLLSRPDYAGHQKPLAANITQMVVVLASRPEPSGYLLDQYCIAAELIGVKALVALNKSDLLESAAYRAFSARFEHYPVIGYPLIATSAKREHGLDALFERLRGETSILVGQSGVGKSSLVNALTNDRSASVGGLSKATGLGRHTTSSATLYELTTGGGLIDSPGVRSFRIGHIERGDLEHGFREFRPYLGHCMFRNCTHQNEPGCALLAGVASGHIQASRLAAFLRLASTL